MERVQKKFAGRKPVRVERLSRSCGYDAIVKGRCLKWALPIALLMQDCRTGRDDEKVVGKCLRIKDLWPPGAVRDYLARVRKDEAEALVALMSSVSEETPMEEFREVDRRIRDWKILVVVSFFTPEGLAARSWVKWLDWLHDLDVKVEYYRIRDRVRRRDPVEKARKLKAQRKYRRTDAGRKMVRDYWQRPEVKARKAAQMRARRAAKGNKDGEVRQEEAQGQAAEAGALYHGVRQADLQEPPLRGVQGEAPGLSEEDPGFEEGAEVDAAAE